MSHVAHMNDSCHKSMSCVTHANESCRADSPTHTFFLNLESHLLKHGVGNTSHIDGDGSDGGWEGSPKNTTPPEILSPFKVAKAAGRAFQSALGAAQFEGMFTYEYVVLMLYVE